MTMTDFTSDSRPTAPSRFRVLINGFAEGTLFPTLHHALNSVPSRGVAGMSFEIYDAFERRFVWSRPSDRDSRSYPGAFSVRVNGYSTGLTFASLAEAIKSMAIRPYDHDYDVFENEVRVFVKSHPPDVRLVEAL